MFIYDLKKVLLNKKSLFLIGLLLLMNSLLFYAWNTSTNIKAEDYKRIQAHISGLPLHTASKYLQQQIFIAEKDASKGTSDLKTLQLVDNEVQKLINYPTYLNKLQNQDETQDISIFHEGGFLNELQDKIKKQYAHKNIQAGNSTKGNYGIEQMIKYWYIDLFAILLLLYCLYIQIQKEDETGCLSYVKSMPKGTLKNYCSKLLSIIGCLCLFLFIAYLLMFFIAGLQYGFADVFRPVQSIAYCQSIPYESSIMMFFLYAICMRFGVYILLGTMIYAFAFIFKKLSLSIIGLFLLIFALQIYSFIGADNNSVQHYLSLLLLLHPEKLWLHVTYVSIFSHAVYFVVLYIGWGIFASIGFFFGYIRYLAPTKEHVQRALTYRRMKYHTIAYYEFKKTWITGFGLVLLLLLIAFSIHTMMDIKSFSTYDDNRVAYYISAYGDSPTKETLTKINKEEARFKQIQEKLEKALTANDIYRLSQQLDDYNAFENYRTRMNALHQDTLRKVIKEDQTRLFFGQDDTYAAFLFCFLCIMILLCMQSYSKEQVSGVDMLQNVTNYGRRKLLVLKHRVISTGFIMSIIILNIYLLFKNNAMYPSVSYSDHLNDIQNFMQIGIHISIAGYLFFQIIIQILASFMISYCLLFVFSKMKANKIVAIICVLLGGIPLILVATDFSRTTMLFSLFFPYSSFLRWGITTSILVVCFIICRLYNSKNYT